MRLEAAPTFERHTLRLAGARSFNQSGKTVQLCGVSEIAASKAAFFSRGVVTLPRKSGNDAGCAPSLND